MGWREEEKIANEIAWAKADIVRELENNREALNRASSSTSSNHHEPIFSLEQRRKLIIIVVSILFSIGVLSDIGIGIIVLLHKYGIINF